MHLLLCVYKKIFDAHKSTRFQYENAHIHTYPLTTHIPTRSPHKKATASRLDALSLDCSVARSSQSLGRPSSRPLGRSIAARPIGRSLGSAHSCGHMRATEDSAKLFNFKTGTPSSLQIRLDQLDSNCSNRARPRMAKQFGAVGLIDALQIQVRQVALNC